MRLFATLRGRLIAMVAALVAVTIGSVTLITTRVAHYEIKKLVSADGTLTIERQTSGGRTREVIRGPRTVVRDGDSGLAERTLMLPLHSKPSCRRCAPLIAHCSGRFSGRLSSASSWRSPSLAGSAYRWSG